MTFDIHREAEPHTGGSAFEPLTGAASRVKKSLRSRSGGLLTSTALVSVGFAFVAGSAAAQVPAGYAPAPAEVVSYVQLSNGSVLVQLANNQSLLVTSNNYFIDGAGVLYLLWPPRHWQGRCQSPAIRRHRPRRVCCSTTPPWRPTPAA